MSIDATPSSPALESAGPNWKSIDEEIRCPLCEYHLRGLVEPRCPECGYRFVWEELIDPSRRLHPYLFEHHPERRFWSFHRTLFGGFRPRKFWKALHPAQPSSPKRLVLYWALAVLPMFLTAASNVCGLAVMMRRDHQTNRVAEKKILAYPQNAELARTTIQQYGSIENYLDQFYPVEWAAVFRTVWSYHEVLVPLLLPLGLVLAWPWVTIPGLMVFQISMKRARIRSDHVLRCVVYSADVVFWLGLALVPVVWIFVFLPATPRMAGNYFRAIPYEAAGCVAAFVIFCYRLFVGYRSYLRFRRSTWVILAAQIIGLLVFLNLFSLLVALLAGN